MMSRLLEVSEWQYGRAAEVHPGAPVLTCHLGPSCLAYLYIYCQICQILMAVFVEIGPLRWGIRTSHPPEGRAKGASDRKGRP